MFTAITAAERGQNAFEVKFLYKYMANKVTTAGLVSVGGDYYLRITTTFHNILEIADNFGALVRL
jgi:hypothetical protein